MQSGYKPRLGGFADKLGLKNGIDDLIKRPVPRQEILYLNKEDINGSLIDGNRGNKYNMRRRKRRRY